MLSIYAFRSSGSKYLGLKLPPSVKRICALIKCLFNSLSFLFGSAECAGKIQPRK